MVKWEYAMYYIDSVKAVFIFENKEDILEHDGNATTTLRHLDKFGAEGWEVISTNFDKGSTIYMLMRPRD